MPRRIHAGKVPTGQATALASALLASVGGCIAPSVGPICPMPDGATVEQQALAQCACLGNVIAEGSYYGFARPKFDLLFVVANTASMLAKQRVLVDNFSLITSQVLPDADVHLGVISTDIGSWVAPDQPWAISAGNCDSFAGDDGRLQATSCLDRANIPAAAQQACQAVCPDRRLVPTDGLPFITSINGKTNVPAVPWVDPNTGFVVDRGPEVALKCMALLGDSGCILSAPLESAARALDGHSLQNSGFLRPDSYLSVIFLTDSDDCSVQLGARSDNDPQTQNCPNPDFTAAPTCFDLSYRCLAQDLVCDQPMNTAGVKTGCSERAPRYLEPVEQYVQFFMSLHPLSRLKIVGIWPRSALDSGQLLVVQNQKIAGSPGLQAGVGCQSATDPSITGQPQTRLSRFLAAFLPIQSYGISDITNEESSVCDTSTLPDVLMYWLPEVFIRGGGGQPHPSSLARACQSPPTAIASLQPTEETATSSVRQRLMSGARTTPVRRREPWCDRRACGQTWPD